MMRASAVITHQKPFFLRTYKHESMTLKGLLPAEEAKLKAEAPMKFGTWEVLSPQKRVKSPIQNEQQVTPGGSTPH